ncbi:hypothetical protein V8F06_003475 [Rhypophila decipiens]
MRRVGGRRLASKRLGRHKPQSLLCLKHFLLSKLQSAFLRLQTDEMGRETMGLGNGLLTCSCGLVCFAALPGYLGHRNQADFICRPLCFLLFSFWFGLVMQRGWVSGWVEGRSGRIGVQLFLLLAPITPKTLCSFWA